MQLPANSGTRGDKGDTSSKTPAVQRRLYPIWRTNHSDGDLSIHRATCTRHRDNGRKRSKNRLLCWLHRERSVHIKAIFRLTSLHRNLHSLLQKPWQCYSGVVFLIDSVGNHHYYLAPWALQLPLYSLVYLKRFGPWSSAAVCKEYSMEISESRKPSWRKSLTHQIFHKVCPRIFFTVVSVLLTLRYKSICSHIPSMGSGFYIWVGYELPSILIYADLGIRPIIGGVLLHPVD